MEKTDKKNKIKKNILGSELTIILAYIVLCVIFGMLSENFLTMRNFINIGIYSAIIGITAAGATIILINGCIDISVGSIMGLTGMVCAIMFRSGQPLWITIVVAILTGFIAGSINGIIVAFGKIVPMIATLATMSIFRGISFLTNNGVSIVISNNNFKWMGRGYIGPVPFLVILLFIFYLIMFYTTKYTSFGRKIFATGANSRASYLAGINTKKVTFIVYAVCGTLAGVSGMLMSAQAGAGLPSAGTGYEMTIISACVLGGTSIQGGKGNVWGTLIGVLLLTTISNGLTMMGVSTFWQDIITGGILLVAVFVDVLRSGGYRKV